MLNMYSPANNNQRSAIITLLVEMLPTRGIYTVVIDAERVDILVETRIEAEEFFSLRP